MTSSNTDVPEDVPEEVTTVFEGSSDSQLRVIIHYAQQLLREHQPLTDAIESREGEELVRTTDHGAYTTVVVERPNETGQARGPFLYRIKWEPYIDDEGVGTNGIISGEFIPTLEVTGMTESFFRRVIVPVANRDDAAATAAALHPYVGADSTVSVVHVIEKDGGAPDKASVEQLQQHAEEIFSIVTEGFDDTDVVLETDLRYGTNIASSIVCAAHDKCASAIVFTPRGGSRWRKLLTGDVSHNLVRSSDIPILVLSDLERGRSVNQPDSHYTNNHRANRLHHICT